MLMASVQIKNCCKSKWNTNLIGNKTRIDGFDLKCLEEASMMALHKVKYPPKKNSSTEVWMIEGFLIKLYLLSNNTNIPKKAKHLVKVAKDLWKQAKDSAKVAKHSPKQAKPALKTG